VDHAGENVDHNFERIKVKLVENGEKVVGLISNLPLLESNQVECQSNLWGENSQDTQISSEKQPCSSNSRVKPRLIASVIKKTCDVAEILFSIPHTPNRSLPSTSSSLPPESDFISQLLFSSLPLLYPKSYLSTNCSIPLSFSIQLRLKSQQQKHHNFRFRSFFFDRKESVEERRERKNNKTFSTEHVRVV
jgi:hypothetical protein